MCKIILVALIFFFLQGCSSRTAYDALQSRERIECGKIPGTTEYQQCMERASENYDSYSRKREQELGEK